MILSNALTGVFGRDLLSYNVLLNWRRQIPRGWISNHWCFNECIAAHWWHHKNCRNKLLANTVSCILFIFLSFSSTYIIMKAYYLLLEQKSFHHFVGPNYALIHYQYIYTMDMNYLSCNEEELVFLVFLTIKSWTSCSNSNIDLKKKFYCIYCIYQ